MYLHICVPLIVWTQVLHYNTNVTRTPQAACVPQFQFSKEQAVSIGQRPVGLSKEPGLGNWYTNKRASLSFGHWATFKYLLIFITSDMKKEREKIIDL